MGTNIHVFTGDFTFFTMCFFLKHCGFIQNRPKCQEWGAFCKSKAWLPHLSLWQLHWDITVLMPHWVNSEGNSNIKQKVQSPTQYPYSKTIQQNSYQVQQFAGNLPNRNIPYILLLVKKQPVAPLLNWFFNRYCHDFRCSVCSSNSTIHFYSKCQADILW